MLTKWNRELRLPVNPQTIQDEIGDLLRGTSPDFDITIDGEYASDRGVIKTKWHDVGIFMFL